MTNQKHYCPGMFAPGHTMAYVQGERVFIPQICRGLTVDETTKLVEELAELIPVAQMSERGLMGRAIELANVAGNKPLLDMMERTWKDLFTPAPPPVQKHEFPTA